MDHCVIKVLLYHILGLTMLKDRLKDLHGSNQIRILKWVLGVHEKEQQLLLQLVDIHRHLLS